MSYRGLALASFVVVGWLAGCPGEPVEDDGNVTSTTVSSTATSSTVSTSASTASAGGSGGSSEGGQGGQGGSQGGSSQGGSSQGGSSQGGSSQGGSSQGGSAQGGSAQGGSGQGGGMCVATISGDAVCDSCLTSNCCAEADACQINPTQCQPLYTCTFQACITNLECLFPICDAMGMLLVHEPCATCVGANCCVEFKACENDTNCFDCITGVSPSACSATTLDDVFEACHMTHCALECVYL